MGCSSCGSRVRKLATQYLPKDVTPISKELIAEKKNRLALALKYSVVVEEVDSKYTEKIEDDSIIHTA